MRETNPPDPDLDRLLSVLADGLLDEDGEKRLATILRQDPGARKYYLNYLGLTAALQWEYADAAAAPPAPVAVQKPVWRRWAVPLASAAVAILGLFLLLRPAATPLIATIEFTDGAALWTDASGSGDRPVEPDTSLPAGTLRLEGASASAQVRFSDNTLITLNGESDVSISDQDRKRLVLRRGNLTASVTPQPDASPLTITTPAAEIEVIGTILAVEADSDQTSVMVDSGRVRVRRLADGKSIEVGEGRKTKVSLDRSADLTALPAIASPETWDSDLTTGGDRFGIGHSVTVLGKACLEAVPYAAAHRKDLTKVIRNGVSFNADPAGDRSLVQLTPDSRIRLRYRSDWGPTVFLTSQKPDGGFGGNFEYRIPQRHLKPDASGWWEVEVPLSEFKCVKACEKRGFSLDANSISKILVSIEEGKRLQIESVSVTPGPSFPIK